MASKDDLVTYIKLHSDCHESIVFKELHQFQKENKLCDLQVKIGENIFNCHSAVLSASSKYFKKEILKTSENRSAWKITIDITKICSKKTFELILDYIYTSNVLVPVDLIEPFLNESKIFEIDSITPAMDKAFSADVVNTENATAFSLLSFKMNITALKEHCINFLCQNFQEIITRKDFLELTDVIIMEVIKRDELVASSEEAILEAVLMWADHWPSERCNKLVSILKSLRLGLLPETIVAKLMRHHLIKVNPNGWEFVADLSEYFASRKQTLPPFEVSMKCRIQSNVKNSLVQKVSENTNEDIVNNGSAKIVIVGGCDDAGNISKKFQALDLNDITLESLPDLPEPLSSSGSVVIENKLYIVGGANESGRTNSVLCFDTVTKEWLKKASMLDARVCHGLVSIGTKIFAIGGEIFGSKLKSVECYDSVENNWHSLSDLPEPLSDITACSFSNGSCIYCFGGYGKKGSSNRIYKYNVFTDNWSDGGTLPTARFGATAVCINERVFIFGGNNGKDVSEVFEYFPDQKTVIRRKDMPHPRYVCQAVTEKSIVYILGGDAVNTAVDAYDIDKNEWHKMCDIDCQRKLYTAAILKF